jgi:hypothetical protein
MGIAPRLADVDRVPVVVDVVSAIYGFTPADIYRADKYAASTHARRMCWTVAWALTDLRPPQLAALVNRSPRTVRDGVSIINDDQTEPTRAEYGAALTAALAEIGRIQCRMREALAG